MIPSTRPSVVLPTVYRRKASKRSTSVPSRPSKKKADKANTITVVRLMKEAEDNVGLNSILEEEDILGDINWRKMVTMDNRNEKVEIDDGGLNDILEEGDILEIGWRKMVTMENRNELDSLGFRLKVIHGLLENLPRNHTNMRRRDQGPDLPERLTGRYFPMKVEVDDEGLNDILEKGDILEIGWRKLITMENRNEEAEVLEIVDYDDEWLDWPEEEEEQEKEELEEEEKEEEEEQGLEEEEEEERSQYGELIGGATSELAQVCTWEGQ
nr:histone acetyltransferase KAT6B-like [Lytechinus pictus]